MSTLVRAVKHSSTKLRAIPIALLGLIVFAPSAFAQDAAPLSVDEVAYSIDNLILFLSAVLVLFMQAGFAMVESGFNSAKNTVNIMFKNIIDLASGVFFYFLIGYGLMYGNSVLGGFLGFGGLGISAESPEAVAGNLHPQVDFLIPGSLRGHGSNDRIRRGGRPHEDFWLSDLQHCPDSHYLPDKRLLEMGRRLAGPDGLL